LIQKQSSLRADARRNRDRILTIAREHFATHGIDTSLEEIAKAAGVGSATLYRHFPSRDSLLAATLRNSEEQLLAGAEAALQMPHAGTRLQAWLKALQRYMRTFHGLPAPVLEAIKEQASPLAVSCQKLVALTEEFLLDAQNAGHASKSVTASDLFLGALAMAWVADRAEELGSTEEAMDALLAHGYLDPACVPSLNAETRSED